MKIKLDYSPNFSKKSRKLKDIKFIIIHYTGMQSEIESIKKLRDYNSNVSCHYLINRKGKIIQMVKENRIAWHAGKSKWKKFNLLNKYSVGIEIQNPGHTFEYSAFNKKQILSLLKLCKFLKKKLNINKKNILGHSDVSYARKKDPGEKFPWELFAKKNLSLWHNINKTKLASFRKKIVSKTEKNNFFSNLKKIGYFVDSNSKNKKLLTLAFQRKYRTKLLNGIIDKECLLISKNLSKI